MSYRAILAFNAAVDQATKTAEQVENIRQARAKLNQNQQIFDLKKKEVTAKIEAASLKNEGTVIDNQLRRKILEKQFNQQKDIYKGQEAQLNQTEHAVVKKGQMLHEFAAKLFETNPSVQASARGQAQPEAVQGGLNGNVTVPG